MYPEGREWASSKRTNRADHGEDVMVPKHAMDALVRGGSD
jgi:hypothetical protein